MYIPTIQEISNYCFVTDITHSKEIKTLQLKPKSSLNFQFQSNFPRPEETALMGLVCIFLYVFYTILWYIASISQVFGSQQKQCCEKVVSIKSLKDNIAE